jgi:glycosyltransferase involved in cell wall biosynthesis
MTTIAIDGFRVVLERHTSGANYVAQLTRSLASCEEVAQVFLLVPSMPPAGVPASLAGAAKVRFVDARLTYHPTSSFRAQTRWIQLDIPRVLRHYRHSFDYFVAPYHYTPLATPRAVKVGTVVHDLCGLGHGYPKTKLGFYRHLAMLLTAAVRGDVVVPISQHTREQFGNTFRWTRTRLTQPVYNGIDDRTLAWSEVEDSLAALSLDARSYFFGVAAAHPRKGTDLLLGAYDSYRVHGGTKQLVVLGGEANEQLVLGQLAERWHGDVTLLPPVADTVRNALYAGAVALVFPSRCEGFGYPVLEAMRQGCPTVAYSNGPAREIAGGLMPLLDDLSHDAIADSMASWEQLDPDDRDTTSHALIERSRAFGQAFGSAFLHALRRADDAGGPARR